MAENSIDSRVVDQEAYKILQDVRQKIKAAAGSDPDRWFYLNRYVFARLQLDGRAQNEMIRNGLFQNSPYCHHCENELLEIRGIELHRLESDRGYSVENCVLIHRECHQKLHQDRDE
jgi:hypothetical protein